MKLKITEPGWETHTGLFGIVEFVDGVSVGEVSSAEARHLSALIRMETVEGKDPSVAQEILDGYSAPMANATTATADVAPVVEILERYEARQLESIADKSGIKGLRVIGDKLGVKGQSIAELIGKILATAGAESAPAVAEQAESDEQVPNAHGAESTDSTEAAQEQSAAE